MAEVAERLSVVTGKKIEYVNVSPEEATRANLARGVPPFSAEALEELFAERRNGKESMFHRSSRGYLAGNPLALPSSPSGMPRFFVARSRRPGSNANCSPGGGMAATFAAARIPPPDPATHP